MQNPAPDTAPKPRPLLTVQPVFVPRLAVTEAVPAALLGTLLLTMAGGTVLFVLFSLLGLTRLFPVWFLYFFCFACSIVILPPLYYELKKRAYARTRFVFHADHVEFQHYVFLVSRRLGRVRYDAIEGVSQKAGLLQESAGIKTVRLFVPSMAYQNPQRFPGLILKDIPAGKGLGGRIEEILDSSRAPEPAAAV